MFISKTVKHADHGPEAGHPLADVPVSSGFAGNGERIAKPFVHAMTDQPPADAGVDRRTARRDPFQLDHLRFKSVTTPMCRIIIRLDEGGFVHAPPARDTLVIALLQVRSRSGPPSGEQSILAIEPATTDDQPIDRFLDPSDFRA